MKNFDSIVTVGASWSWGSELPSEQRTVLRFDNVLATKLGIDTVDNIARESSTPFCCKWHWIDWVTSNPKTKHPLVLVQVSTLGRHLIYDNQADRFQETPGKLISEKMVSDNWGNNPKSGGFVSAFPNYSDNPSNSKEKVRSNFYRYNYDDKMAEIYIMWEIKLLDLMIKEFGGYPVFWADEYPYNMALPWAQDLLKNAKLFNNLQPLLKEKTYFTKGLHPNALGHERLANGIYQMLIETHNT
jgi:hypothetical protein